MVRPAVGSIYGVLKDRSSSLNKYKHNCIKNFTGFSRTKLEGTQCNLIIRNEICVSVSEMGAFLY